VTTPADGFEHHFINVTVSADGRKGLKLDGVELDLSKFVPIAESGFYFYSQEVTAGVHAMSGPKPFEMYIYGFTTDDSYGYAGGQSLSPVALAKRLTITPPTAVAVIGTQVVHRIKVETADGTSLAGVRVDFTAGGGVDGFTFTDANGVATVSHSSDELGDDPLVVNVGSLKESASVTWVANAGNRPPVVAVRPVTVTLPMGAASVVVQPAALDAGTTDPDGDAWTLSLSPSGPFPMGTSHVDVVAVDSHGLSGRAGTTITVLDAEPPHWKTAPVIQVSTDPGMATCRTLALPTPSLTDNVGVASVVNDAPAQFPLGSTTVTWTATDGSGNQSQIQQTIQVVDGEKPVIAPIPTVIATVPIGQTSAVPVELGTPTATDNVGVVSLTHDGPTTFPLGETVITWTAADAAGNRNSATQRIVVREGQPDPVVTLSSPGDGITFLSGSALHLTAFVANIAHNAVERVEFYDGDTKIAETATSPYCATWPNAALGDHRLKAHLVIRPSTTRSYPATVDSTAHVIHVVDQATVTGVTP
jgi:hypothetical protein